MYLYIYIIPHYLCLPCVYMYAFYHKRKKNCVWNNGDTNLWWCVSEAGGYLKTHDFLQPLERVGTRRACAKEGIIATTTASSELKSPQVLPGGIGTYTISHIPYFYHQRLPKPEVSSPMFTVENSNSNCSSYAANGFTLWDESAGKKDKTSKENVRERTNIRGNITFLCVFLIHSFIKV